MQELRQKGVAGAIAKQAIEDAFVEEETSEETLATAVALKWIERQNPAMTKALAIKDFSPEREKGRRRLHAFLSRRGFAPRAVSSAFGAALDRAADLCA
jgi:SOS response regulatory protein OraA/RecX